MLFRTDEFVRTTWGHETKTKNIAIEKLHPFYKGCNKLL